MPHRTALVTRAGRRFRNMRRPRTSRTIRNFIGKGFACMAAAALIAGTVPATALARNTTYVTVSACRAAEPVADILGADSVEGVNPFQNFNTSASATDGTAGNNQYYLFSSAITAANDVHKTGLLGYIAANSSVASLSDSAANSYTYVPGTGVTLRNGSGGGPNKAFLVSNATDYNYLTTMQPDLVVGNGDTDEGSFDFDLDNDGTDDFSVPTVPWIATKTDDILDSLSTAATVLDSRATATGKSLRYGSASTIANSLREYVEDIESYVNGVITATPSAKKKVAVITAVDASDGSCTLGTASTVGTSTNRLVEAVNKYVTLDTTSTTIAQVYANNAFVIVGGSQGVDSGMPDSSGNELIDTVYQYSGKSDSVFRGMTYWTNTRGAGALYGTVMNAPDNLQNYGRILTLIYPNSSAGFTQDAAMTYWVHKFYHVDGEANIRNAMAVLFGTDDNSIQYVAGTPAYTDTSTFEEQVLGHTSAS